jgi:mRNA-degrading endonuclease RelE of RelBE toxin-antitoxin system
MSYSVVLTDNFKREAKRLLKKYPSLKSELQELGEILTNNPTTGTHLGNDVYKIRLAIKSKGKGKRGGARVLTQLIVIRQTIYLFAIYDKGERDSLSDNEIRELLGDL